MIVSKELLVFFLQKHYYGSVLSATWEKEIIKVTRSLLIIKFPMGVPFYGIALLFRASHQNNSFCSVSDTKREAERDM